jgi:transcriptional regulator with XRE-family HTH domain
VNIFAKRVCELREVAGLSQVALAEKLGLNSGASVQKWEKGEGFPEVKTLIQLASVLNSSVGELLGESGPPLKHGRALEETIRQIAREEIGSQIAKIAAGESDVPGLLEVAKVFLKEAGIALGSKEQLKRGSA